MNNNRKRTRGRLIQSIDVPVMIRNKEGALVRNRHPKAGKQIQVRHEPPPKTAK